MEVFLMWPCDLWIIMVFAKCVILNGIKRFIDGVVY